MHLSDLLAQQGGTDEAVGLLESVALTNPIKLFRQTAARQLAKLLSPREDRAERLLKYRGLLEKDPGDEALRGLVVCLQNGDPQVLVEVLALAMRADPDDVDLKRQYAAGLLEAGRLDEAREALSDLMRDFRDHPAMKQFACEKLAEVAARKREPDKAEALIRQGAPDISDPTRKSLYFSRAYLRLGLLAPAERHARARRS